MKKNVVIVLMGLVVLGLGGYIVYDKFLSNTEHDEPEQGDYKNSYVINGIELNKMSNIIENELYILNNKKVLVS